MIKSPLSEQWEIKQPALPRSWLIVQIQKQPTLNNALQTTGLQNLTATAGQLSLSLGTRLKALQ